MEIRVTRETFESFDPMSDLNVDDPFEWTLHGYESNKHSEQQPELERWRFVGTCPYG